ncbi:hypothetical protein VHEMI01411 [[Torrubiella] hemipterigena]|uniref:Uncharacterized protein n=1 Tax=[Torrubiella] hemipterigena TaxID=1531966 RepID=A0A0A1SLV2_9HYPO|nr:hypothetical protein VHEMI01411 [[Torrubiella] hemipterigena]
MADELVPSPAIEAFRAIISFLRSIPYMRIARAASVPLQLAAIPLGYLLEVLLVIFAPAIFIVKALLGMTHWIYSFLAGLKPLYSFLSAAAGVGILAGIILGIASVVITSYLGMQDGQGPIKEEDAFEKSYAAALRRNSTASSSFTGESSSDAEWQQWAEATATAALASPRRRLPPGLLSQTIHEEDDDDSEY